MAVRFDRYLALEQHRIIAGLQARPEHADPLSLIPHGWKMYSQNASLSYLAERLGRKGYALVACNLTGSNAFFVQADLTAGRFHEPFTAEHHYQPPRYFLSPLRVGHLPSYRTLDDRVTA